MSLNRKIKGAVVAAVTPATEDYGVDYKRLREQFRFIIEGGIQNDIGCLLAVGGGGEGYFLNDEQWKKSVNIFAEEAVGKVPTLVGVFDLNALHAIDKIKYAESLGVDFVQVAPPHYEKPTHPEVYDYYKMLSDSCDNIGIVLYHTYWALPEYYEFNAELANEISKLENVVGIKWASSNLSNFLNVINAIGDKLAVIDNQGWLQQVKNNLDGALDAFMYFVGNYNPKRGAKISKLLKEGKYQKFAEEMKDSNLVRKEINNRLLDAVHGSESGEIRSLAEGSLAKATMDVAGRHCGPAFPPQHNLSEEVKEELRKEFF